MVEVIIADQRAIGFAAELAEFLFVDLLEDRRLVPCRAFELAQGLVQVLLGDVHHPDLQHLIGFGVVHEVVQTAPGAFHLLKIGVVQDQVDLFGQLLVDLRDDAFDRPQGVVRNQRGIGQRLLRPAS